MKKCALSFLHKDRDFSERLDLNERPPAPRAGGGQRCWSHAHAYRAWGGRGDVSL